MDLASASAKVATSEPRARTLVIPPDGGKTLVAFGGSAQVKLSGEQTNGSMLLAVSTTPPGWNQGAARGQHGPGTATHAGIIPGRLRRAKKGSAGVPPVPEPDRVKVTPTFRRYGDDPRPGPRRASADPAIPVRQTAVGALRSPHGRGFHAGTSDRRSFRRG